MPLRATGCGRPRCSAGPVDDGSAGGDGEVEALYGRDEDNNEKRLWPLDAEDAEAGCDDL